MAGISGRKLAEELGISEGAVRKARATRLKGAVLPDGTYDLEKAKALYARNTDPAMQRPRASAPPPVASAPAGDSPVPEAGRPTAAPAANADYGKVRTALTYEQVLIAQVKRKKAQGTAIERVPTLTAAQTLSRMFRDGALGFTDKYHTQIAAELGLQDHTDTVYEVLNRYMRLYVQSHIAKVKNELLP